MNNKEVITELKKKLENIYSNLRRRIDPKLWTSAIKQAYEVSPEETSIQVIDFVQKHNYMPCESWRAVCSSIELRNNPVAVSNIYSEAIIDSLYKRMTKPDIIRYDYISADKSEKEIRHIMDLAEKADEYMGKGQIYLAGKVLDELSNLCPTHPDVLGMKKKYAVVKADGGVKAEEFRGPDPLKKYDNNDEGKTLVESGKTDAAMKYYENLINSDSHNYSAYYPLGVLYVQSEELKKADYIADLLLDFNRDVDRAKVLKGMILEKYEKNEDALFYYNSALMDNPENEIARNSSMRLFEDVEPGSSDTTDFIIKCARTGQKPARKTKIQHISEPVLSLVEGADELIKKGRLTEAYYELVKKSEKYETSDLLTYKKALILYAMKREPEARQILRTIKPDSVLYERAEYLIHDIDRNIVENKKYDDIEELDLAEILFDTQKFKEALEIYQKKTDAEMNANAWSVKGRCEIALNMINEALRSFSNATKEDGKIQNVRELMGLIYQVKGDTDRALEYYDESIKISRNPEYSCELKAALLYDAGRYDDLRLFREEAVKHTGEYSVVNGYAGLVNLKEYHDCEEDGLAYMEDAIASGKGTAEFYVTAIESYIKQNRLVKAMICTEHGLARVKDTEELYMKKAELQYLSGKLHYAEIIAGILLTGKPDSAEVQYLMGRICADRGEDRDAAKWFKSAADLDSENHKYAYALADKCFETGDMITALIYYTKAITLDDSDYISYKRRALIYAGRDEDEKAMEDINNAIAIRPDDPEIYLIIGNILADYELEDNSDLEDSGAVSDTEHDSNEDTAGIAEREGEGNTSDGNLSDEDVEKDSEYYYSMAVSIDKNYRQGYICRARFYADKGRLNEAMADVESAMALNPEAEDSYMIRGIVRHLSGDNENAVSDFEKASSSKELRTQAYSYMAKCYNAMEKYEDAVASADRGLEINPDFLNYYVNRGVALYHLAKYNQAIEDFRRVIMRKNAINTAAVEVSYKFRGLSSEQLGRIEDAAADYRMLLKYNPDHRDIKKRLEDIEKQLDDAKPKQRFSLFHRKKK